MFETIGCDVEVFAKDKEGNHVALCGLIGGTKEAPLQIEDLPQGFAVQEDNVSLEYNIPPCNSKNEFVDAINTMKHEIKHILKYLGYTLSFEASASFDKKQLTHPNALIFGCEPDYNAWKLVENEKPYSPDETLRTCGGHIHVGTDIDFVPLIQAMDLYIGVPSVLLDTSPSSLIRKQLYGKAGAMRPKSYGGEYRVTSNYWMFDPNIVAWIYNQTKRLCSERPIKFTEKQAKDIQTCINTNNSDMAKTLIGHFGIHMP
jgi:hypothetical protein